MSQDTTRTISTAVEPSEDEVGHRIMFGTPEVTDEVEEAEVEGHRIMFGTPEVTDDPEPEVEGHRLTY